MGKMKLSYTTKVELTFETEEELQMVMRNMPWMRSQPGFTSAQSNVRHIESATILSLPDIEKNGIIEALDRCPTKTAAAKTLNITTATLYAKIKQYGINT